LSEKESIKNWVIILAALVLTSLVAVAWPAVVGGFQSPTGASVRPEVPVVTLPSPIFNMTEVNGLVLVGALAVLVIGTVVVVGAIIGMAYRFLAKQTETIKDDKDFQSHLANLEARQKESVQKLRADRQAGPIPDHNQFRWSVVSTSLVSLFLVYVATVVVNQAVIARDAQIMIGSFGLSTRLVITVSSLLVTLLILLGRMRVERFAQMTTADNGPIPWDSIWVVLTGLVVVGIGIGFLVYLNVPG